MTIKQWLLTFHAKERMREREISLTEIEEIIRKPDNILNQGDKYIFVKNITGRQDNALAIVLVKESTQVRGEIWVIITTMINFRVF